MNVTNPCRDRLRTRLASRLFTLLLLLIKLNIYFINEPSFQLIFFRNRRYKRLRRLYLYLISEYCKKEHHPCQGSIFLFNSARLFEESIFCFESEKVPLDGSFDKLCTYLITSEWNVLLKPRWSFPRYNIRLLDKGRSTTNCTKVITLIRVNRILRH